MIPCPQNEGMKKLTEVQVNVPYKSAGNIILQKEVGFEVYKDSELYSLKPLLSQAERTIANLPESLNFTFENGKAVSTKGIKDGNLHVIQDVVKHLRAQHLML